MVLASRRLFSGVFVCTKNDNNSIVAILDICDEYEKYEGE